MILQKLAKAIQEQNWFTVAIEIMIVVIGIFLGLQVTEWNEGRKDRIKEREFIERLHSNTIDAVEMLKPWFERSAEHYDHFNTIVDMLRAEQVERSLTPQECGAIITSNRYGAPRAVLPAIEELMSTGKLSIIQSSDIRNVITSLTRMTDELNELNLSINHNVAVLQKKYPSLIPLDDNYSQLVSFHGNSSSCVLEKMRSNQGFKNDLFDNVARHHYHALSLQREQDMLENLHKLTDTFLEFNHQNEEPTQ